MAQHSEHAVAAMHEHASATSAGGSAESVGEEGLADAEVGVELDGRHPDRDRSLLHAHAYLRRGLENIPLALFQALQTTY